MRWRRAQGEPGTGWLGPSPRKRFFAFFLVAQQERRSAGGIAKLDQLAPLVETVLLWFSDHFGLSSTLYRAINSRCALPKVIFVVHRQPCQEFAFLTSYCIRLSQVRANGWGIRSMNKNTWGNAVLCGSKNEQ